MDHLEEHLVKYLNPDWKPQNKNLSVNFRRYTCRVPVCDYNNQLTLIGKVIQFLKPAYQMTNVHSWFVIEFRVGEDKHLKIANKNQI
jgi:hypothetical protein